jgi:hypothetical protein
LSRGLLPADVFVPGQAAKDASERIIYDTGSGTLYHTADGTGPTEAIAFAETRPCGSAAASHRRRVSAMPRTETSHMAT